MSSLATLLSDYEIVDLSVLLAEEMPSTWPGHVPFQHKAHNWYEPIDGPAQPVQSAAPYYTCWMMLDEHAGTHFDAPPHFVPPPESALERASGHGLEYGDRVTLVALQGPAAVVDVQDAARGAGAGVSPRITPDDLARWETSHGGLEPGEVVLLRTGWDRHYLPPPDGSAYLADPVVHRSAPGWPAPTADAVLFLHDRGIRTVGVDAPSVGAADEGISMHRAGLERGMLYVEGLTGLGGLPARGAYFVFLPLKVARSSGGPGRAVAYVPRSG